MTGASRSADRIIAAVAIIRDGRVLAGRRVGPPAVRGGWEFPGGQVEPGEAPEQAAVREAREELGVEVSLTGDLGTVPIRPGMPLVVFTAALTCGEPAISGSHDALRWVGPEELGSLRWLPADRPLLGPLADRLRAGPGAPTRPFAGAATEAEPVDRKFPGAVAR